MSWDPLERWPHERAWIWASFALWLCVFRGTAFIDELQTRAEFIPDFFQEYASARNWFEGLPIYTGLVETVPRYLGTELDLKHSYVRINAHPPTSVLFALPFALLDFDQAFLAWNLVSLGAFVASLAIVVRQLNLAFRFWSLAPLVALLLVCHPLWEELRLGQWALVLTLLLTGTWAAERTGRPRLAGALLALAAAIKLFPAFLFFYYALRGRWRVVLSGVATLVALTALTASVLGVDCYVSYARDVLPAIQWFRVGWNNASVWGFWSRLFDPAPERERLRSLTTPLWYNPALAQAASWASCLALAAVVGWVVRRDRDGMRADATFAVATVVMLLVSPIAWEHYFLLLLVPLAVVWITLPAAAPARGAFAVALAGIWIGPPLTWTMFDLNGRSATPLEAVGVLSFPFYALLTLLGLAVAAAKRQTVAWFNGPRLLALGACVSVALWAHIVLGVWRTNGVFELLGGDFGIYLSIAKARLADGPTAMYDMEAISRHAENLRGYYGPESGGLNVGPGPYPALYIAPFVALSYLTPPVGFLIWTLGNLVLAIAVARGMCARFQERSWGLVASAVLFFPIPFCLFFGQLSILMLYGFYRAYLELEKGRDFRAGLWCGTLLLKPQNAAFLGLVFLIKGRWRAVGGLLTVGLAAVAASWGIVGVDGLRAQYETLRSLSGFRDVLPIISPHFMMNWRGVLVNILPSDASERSGQLLTTVLALLTTATLPLIWRGRWASRDGRFTEQMLATVIVALLAGYHTHAHSGVLLLVPALALAARWGGTKPWRVLLPLGLYGPLPIFFLTGSIRFVSLGLVALLLTALVMIVKEQVCLGASSQAPANREDQAVDSPCELHTRATDSPL